MTFTLYLVAAALGALGTALLGLLYAGKTSFIGASLDEIFSAPPGVLAAPLAVTSLVASSLVGLQTEDEQVATTWGFILGCVLGALAGVMLFFWIPCPGYGFVWHAAAGLMLGGALGGGTAFLSFRIAG
jgi:hypothetical protein